VGSFKLNFFSPTSLTDSLFRHRGRYINADNPSYFYGGQLFGGVGGVAEGSQGRCRPVGFVLAHQMVRRLGDEHGAEQVQHHPDGAHDAKRNVRRERAERVRIQYAGDDEELKYRAQTTYTIETNTAIVKLPKIAYVVQMF